MLAGAAGELGAKATEAATSMPAANGAPVCRANRMCRDERRREALNTCVTVVGPRLGLKTAAAGLWNRDQESRSRCKGTVMQSGGTPDMSALFAQAQQVQQQLMEAQEKLAATDVQGQAGGGLVQVTMKGSGEVVAVAIDPKVIDRSDPRNAARPHRRRAG